MKPEGEHFNLKIFASIKQLWNSAYGISDHDQVVEGKVVAYFLLSLTNQ